MLLLSLLLLLLLSMVVVMMMMVVGGIKGSLPVLIKIKIQNNCSMEILRLESLV